MHRLHGDSGPDKMCWTTTALDVSLCLSSNVRGRQPRVRHSIYYFVGGPGDTAVGLGDAAGCGLAWRDAQMDVQARSSRLARRELP
jgi:hypothetical protein